MLWQGVATTVLCQAYARTHDKALLAPAQKAVDFICAMQDPTSGGWPDRKEAKPFTVVAAWQILALKNAHMAYLRVPPTVVKKAFGFLTVVQADGGARYGKTSPKDVDDVSTAAGLLCRMYLGWKKDNPALGRGIVHLGKVGPAKRNIVYIYFAQQAMWHWQGDSWKTWDAALRAPLINAQVTEGDEAGSWFDPHDPRAAGGGRLFQTALSVNMWEVYSRPIYRPQASEEDFPE